MNLSSYSIIKFTVSITDTGCRIDQFLKRQIKEKSRESIKNHLKSGNIKVNGKRVKANYRIKLNDEIEYNIIPEGKIHPEDIDINVIYEDDDIVVIDKPSGLLTHPTCKNKNGTLVNGLLKRFKKLSDSGSERPGIVHRLDRFTSGLILIAKNDDTATTLKEEFKNRDVQKEYIAIVEGVVKEKCGISKTPIGRAFGRGCKMRIKGKKFKDAETRWDLLEILGNVASLLSVKPRTGRTHQIRVHMKEMGHPIIGDRLYKHKRSNAPVTLERQALHAHKLAFSHPKTGNPMHFESEIPTDMVNLMIKLRNLK